MLQWHDCPTTSSLLCRNIACAYRGFPQYYEATPFPTVFVLRFKISHGDSSYFVYTLSIYIYIFCKGEKISAVISSTHGEASFLPIQYNTRNETTHEQVSASCLCFTLFIGLRRTQLVTIILILQHKEKKRHNSPTKADISIPSLSLCNISVHGHLLYWLNTPVTDPKSL